MKLLASLRARVAALLALAILPLFILSLQVNLEARSEALRQAEERLGRIAKIVSKDEQQVVGYTKQILQIMANADDLERLDSPDCSALARRLLSTQPLFNNFGAALPSGKIVCSGMSIEGRPVSVSERPWFVEAMTYKRFTQGNRVVGKISGKIGIVFGLPILTPTGDLRGAVFTNVSLAWFDRLLASLELPPSWEAGILDKEAQILTRLPSQNTPTTQVATREQWQSLMAQPTLETQRLSLLGQDNIERITLLTPLNTTQGDIWFYISAPKAEITGPAEKIFRTQLLIFLIVALLAGSLGFWALDRSILAWARNLARTARNFGSGDLDARITEDSPIQELAELNQSFNQMADKLQTRQQQQETDSLHIAELNRLYSLLSAVNQTIVSANSRRELLRRICQIAIENGGFALAWAGFVDGDTQELAPVMHAGDAAFLHHGERPEGPSPAATAYHSGRVAVVNDIAQNPPGIWRDSAYAAGFRAAVGVPLSQREQVVGVLTLYASTPGFFDTTELRLLEEVGGDISYALDRLDSEAARQVAEARVARLNEELEQRVAQRTAALVAANQDLEAFSYSVSHDLRAPLRAISGFTQILLKRHLDALNTEGRHYLDNVALASERMSRLIDELLRYSRLGRRGITIARVDLARIVKQTLDNLGARIQSTGAQITLGELPMIQSDPTLIEQILTNLVDNALTYHLPDQPPRISIEACATPQGWTLSISDQGIGIPPEFHDKVFAVFQRLHNDEDYPGTGIGLAIVKKAVQHLGGEVQLASTPGVGTTFTIHLPDGERPA